MEQTVVRTNIRRIFHFKAFPSITLRVTSILMVILVTAVLVVSAIAKDTGNSVLPDTFGTFTAFFPGQALDTRVLVKQGFSCTFVTLPTPADVSETCRQSLHDGMFSEINLTIWDGVIKWLNLKVREGNLDVGNLSLQWGSPEIRIDGNWVTLSWPSHHVTGLGWTTNRHFTYFQALSYITFAI